MNKLTNKIAVVTGGTTGIGLATTQRFASEGATVIATGRNPKTLASAREQLGDSIEVVKSDAGSEDDIAGLLEGVKAKHGRIDVLFLNAGIALFAPLEEATIDDFDAMWRVNVRGPWLTLQSAIPLLSEGASVIINTSVAHHKGIVGSSAYGSTKAALRSIVRIAAAELAPKKIRVNAIAPGLIETPIYGKLGMSAEAVGEFSKAMLGQVPLARFGVDGEIAAAAVFLACEDSSYVTGTELAVDGGYAQV